MPEEMKGWHMMGQAGLNIQTKTTIIGACSAEATYEEIKEQLLRIMADREVKTEAAWAEKEKREEFETIEVTCYRYGEKGHISRKCNQKEKEYKHCGRKGNVENGCWERNMKCWRCQKVQHRESKCG